MKPLTNCGTLSLVFCHKSHLYFFNLASGDVLVMHLHWRKKIFTKKRKECCDPGLEYARQKYHGIQHRIQWTLKVVKDSEWRRRVWMEMQKLKQNIKRKDEKRGRGFKLQPLSHWVHWHLHLTIPHSFSETALSLLSIPENNSCSYIHCRMRPFTFQG